jgi:hypothetical protein
VRARVRAGVMQRVHQHRVFVRDAVREKAKQLVELLNDTPRIREERERAKALRDKFVGIAGEDRFGGGVCR